MITLRSASRSRGGGRLRRLLTTAALAATSIIAISAAGPAPVSANALDQGVVVNPDPVDNTPYAMNGRVYAFATVGNTVVVGGTFTTLRNAGNPTDISQPYLFSYNRNTGQINTAFDPVLDNWVDAMEISPDGQSVIVGGKFQNVNGTSRPSLAKISLSNGNLVGGFNANVAGRVRDLDLHGGKVYIGGDIWSVGGQQRSRMAAVDANTGAVDSTFTVGTTLPRNTVDWVSKIDVRPNGDEAVIIGNFAEVDNQPRMQFAVIDLTGPTAQLSPYTAPQFEDPCNTGAFWTYMRDVEYAPDGEYMAVATTGGPFGLQICDTITRFESDGGPGQLATWIDWSGGDTLSAVAISDVAVYFGGHQRWMNNRRGRDNAYASAEVREGIGALDPINGVPLSWNPGKSRGVAVFDLHLTPEGMLVGSDTDFTAGEYHPKIAEFPLGGGVAPPVTAAAELPVLAYSSLGSQLSSQTYDGTNFGALTAVDNTVVNWNQVVATWEEAGRLYYVRNGDIRYRDFDGTNIGSTETSVGSWINWSSIGGNEGGGSLNAAGWHDGAIYYTAGGELRASYLSLESGIVGSEQFRFGSGTGGINWNNVRGIDFIGDQMYFTSTDGNLRRLDMTGNSQQPIDGIDNPNFGSIAVVSGPTAGDGQVWNGSTLMMRDDDIAPPNTPPTITQIGNQTDDEGQFVSLFASATDPDPDTLEFSATGLPDDLDIDPSTGEISGQLDQNAAFGSPYAVTVTVDDGRGGTDSTMFQWTVNQAAGPQNVLFVGRDATVHSIDVPFVDRLTARNFLVNYVDDDALVAADLNGMDLVLVSTSMLESNAPAVAAVLAGANVPVGSWQAFANEDLGMGTGEGRDSTGSSLIVVNAAHPIAVAAGVSGTITMTTSNTAASRLSNPGPAAQVIAETTKNRPSLFVFEQGTIAPARRAGMWPTWNTGTRSTATGFGLFDATVDWLLDTPAPNTPPTINGIADQTNDEGDAASVMASATDPDPDTLSFSAVGLPDSVTINSATGEMSGVIDQDAATGSPYSVMVTVSDGRGGTDSTSFQWTVNPTADAPNVLVVGRTPTVYSIDVPWVDRLVARGFVVTYVDDNAFTAADLVGQDLVLVSTSVIESLSDEVATVAAGANVPVGVWQAFAFEDFGFGTGEGRDSTGSALNIVDAAHPIAVAAGATGTFTVTTSNTAASRLANPGVDAQVIAETDKNRASLFVYEAGTVAPARRAGMWPTWNSGTRATSDGLALFDATVDWLLGVLDPPPTAPTIDFFNPAGPVTATQGVAMPSITVSASDVNGTIPMLSAVGMPTGITFTDNADGTGTIAGTTNDPVGTYTVTVTASDGALTDTDTIDIEVVSPNAAPTVDTFVPTGPVNVVQGEAITTITVTASDPDGTIPTLSATGLPTGITFVDNADGTGTISGSTTDPDGTYTVTVTASDGVLTGTGTIDIEVDPDALVVFARINAAGPLVAATDGGPDWEADTAAANHPFLTNPGSNGNAGDTAVDPGPTVPAHVPGDVVDTERWSNSGFGYTVPVPNGTHVDVRLFVANQYGPTSTPGTRVFDIAIDGNIVADDFDIIPVFGNLTAGMLEYHITSDGAVNIDFSNVIENPLVNAIEVVEADPSPGELAASPTAIDFGDLPINSSASNTVTLSNLGFDAGDPSIDVNSVTVAGGEFSTDFAGPVTVAGGASTTFDVTFGPTAAGTQSTTLTIAHTGTNSPLVVTLDGEGTNTAPTVDSIVPNGPVTAQQNVAISPISVTASDPEGTTPTLSATGMPSGISFADNNDGTGTFTGTTADPTGTYTVTVTASDGALAGTATIDIVVVKQIFARINAGGALVAAIDGGPDWEEDTSGNNHPFLSIVGNNGIGGGTSTPNASVPAHVPASVFTTERWSSSPGFAYSIPVANGTQVTVRLFVGNTCSCTQDPGERVYDITIDGVIVADDLDLSATYGHEVGAMLEYTITSDGAVDLGFVNDVQENPLVNAIEIVAT